MSNLSDIDFFGFSGEMESDAEFIPLITAEEEENVNNQKFPSELPILPLRNNVLFPGVVIPITVGRDKAIKLIQPVKKLDEKTFDTWQTHNFIQKFQARFAEL